MKEILEGVMPPEVRLQVKSMIVDLPEVYQKRVRAGAEQIKAAVERDETGPLALLLAVAELSGAL